MNTFSVEIGKRKNTILCNGEEFLVQNAHKTCILISNYFTGDKEQALKDLFEDENIRAQKTITIKASSTIINSGCMVGNGGKGSSVAETNVIWRINKCESISVPSFLIGELSISDSIDISYEEMESLRQQSNVAIHYKAY